VFYEGTKVSVNYLLLSLIHKVSKRKQKFAPSVAIQSIFKSYHFLVHIIFVLNATTKVPIPVECVAV
ncbi:MAG: hypothetical protein ACKO96_39930, partial [Flammeovirgaceae bacterium]